MPKSSKISGAERYNFLLSLTGFLIQNRQQNLKELAKHFGVTEQEVRDAAVTISLSGVGSYRPDELFFLDYDLLEEGIIDLSFAPTIESVPRLSTRQAAAIASGLSYLESIVEETDKVEIVKLLSILSEGVSTTSELPFKVRVSAPDKELVLSRRAISEERLISCSYINAASQVTVRDIEPISLESNDSIWYLRGYCRSKNEVRIFRLDRMRDISLSEEKLERSEYPEHAASRFYSFSDKDTEVVFEIDPEGFGILADYKPDYTVSGDKTVRVAIRIGDISTLGRVVSKYSGKVRVISPEQARKVVFDYSNRALGSVTPHEIVE